MEELELDDAGHICSLCGCAMQSGFVIHDGELYFCSENCLHEFCTEEEYLEMYDDGNGDSYWTEWE